MAAPNDHELPLLSVGGPATSPRPSHSTEATLANSDVPGFASGSHHEQAKTNRQQYSSVPADADDSAPNTCRGTALKGGPPDDEGQGRRAAKWRPFWLRRVVLGIFCIFFLCCTVALPIVLSSSLRHHGLGQVRQHFAKLWRFGPTAVLTVVSVFWSRVELQALRYMPWTAIQAGQSLDQGTYALDYTAMMPPIVLLRSWRNRHMFVFFVALTSIVLKVQVVLAPSLFYLKNLQDSVLAGVQVLDSFSATADVNETIGDAAEFAPYYNAKAMYDFGLDFPFGVYKEGAYQTFGPETNSTGRGTTESPLEALVDGVFMDMKCLPLENYTVVASDEDNYRLYFDMKFEGCKQRVASASVSPGIWYDLGYYWGVLQPQNDTRPCSSLPQQHDQFIYVGTRWEESKKNDSQPIVHAFAAVICTPRTWMSKVKVVDDGISPNLTRISDQEETPVTTNLWDLLVKSIAAEFGSWTKTVYQARGPILVDRLFRGETMNGTDKSLYHNDVLEKSVLDMTETFGPFVAHYQLRQSSEGQITGSNMVELSRLEVNKNACIAMAVLFAVCTFVALWAALKSHKTYRAWHRNPATILGSAISLFSNSASVAGSLSDGGERRKAIWSQSAFSPMALTTWLRTIFVVYSFGLIVGLAATFGVAQTSRGLVTVNDGTLSIWWTSLPAFCMLLVALYATSSDVAVRSLATLSSLSARACTVQEMDISFLDVLGFRALYYSLRLRPLRVTLTQTVAILCAVLPTLSTLLFVSEGVPQLTSTSFEQQSWLGYRNISWSDGNDNRLSLRSLLLMYHNSNFTWPQSTHADLFFPTLRVDDAGWNWDADYSLKVKAPAARLIPSCAEIPEKDYKVEPNTTLHMTTFTRQLTCPNGTTVPIEDSTYSTQTKGVKSEPFASVANSLHDPQFISSTCTPKENASIFDDVPQPKLYQTYLWGKFSTSTMKMEHVGFWQCNYSWYEVPTEVNLVWANGGFRIDSSNPPVADNSKMRPLDSKLVVPNIYGTSYGPYPNIELRNSTPAFIDYAYRYLMEPFGALEKSSLGEASQDSLILETLKLSTGIIGAQLANIEMRLGLNETSPQEPTSHGSLPAASAVVTNKKRHRLVQNSGITIAIMAILCVAFVVNTWALISACLGRCLGNRRGLLLDMELKGLAPDEFSSIAMLDALLRGSNLLENIPKSAEQISPSELYSHMSGLRLRLGWFFRKGAQEREYTIGVLGDENFQFLGGK